MAYRQNNATRDALATAWGDTFTSGSMEIRTGAQPADPQTAASGTLLATIQLPASAFGAPTTGAIAKAGTWSVTATTSGIAGHARIISSDTLKSFDIWVTAPAGGGEAIINDVDVVQGGTVTVTTFTYTVPSGV